MKDASRAASRRMAPPYALLARDTLGDARRRARADAVQCRCHGRRSGQTSGCIIYTDSADDVIVTVGVHDLVGVKRGNTVVFVDKIRAEDIKAVLEDERLGG